MSVVYPGSPGREHLAEYPDGFTDPPVTVGCERGHQRAFYARILGASSDEGGVGVEGVAARLLRRHLVGGTLSVVAESPPGMGQLVLDDACALVLLAGVRERVEDGYGFAVREANLQAPRTGTFDGREIVLHSELPPYLKSFILLHLFGHSVQWAAPSLADSLVPLETEKDLEKFLIVMRDYEYGAARFGMRLLEELGVAEELGQWFADFVETDRRYVEDWYRRGKGPSPRPLAEFLAHDQHPVEPADIPPLEPRKVELRFAF